MAWKWAVKHIQLRNLQLDEHSLLWKNKLEILENCTHLCKNPLLLRDGLWKKNPHYSWEKTSIVSRRASRHWGWQWRIRVPNQKLIPGIGIKEFRGACVSEGKLWGTKHHSSHSNMKTRMNAAEGEQNRKVPRQSCISISRNVSSRRVWNTFCFLAFVCTNLCLKYVCWSQVLNCWLFLQKRIVVSASSIALRSQWGTEEKEGRWLIDPSRSQGASWVE